VIRGQLGLVRVRGVGVGFRVGEGVFSSQENR